MTKDELRTQIRVALTGVLNRDRVDLIDGLEEFVCEHSAQVWDEAVATALEHAIRNDDGITLRLEKPNPWREQTPASFDITPVAPACVHGHALLPHVYWSSERSPVVYLGTCAYPDCAWRSSDCIDPTTVQALFEEHLEQVR